MAMLSDCAKCKGANPRVVRQSLGCGYEQPTETVVAWDHSARKMLTPDDRPKHCIGYTSRLPEVVEILRARAHWERGHLPLACDEAPHEHALIAIEILEASNNELQRARMTPVSQGGMGDG